jgi:hypothetical protein
LRRLQSRWSAVGQNDIYVKLRQARNSLRLGTDHKLGDPETVAHTHDLALLLRDAGSTITEDDELDHLLPSISGGFAAAAQAISTVRLLNVGGVTLESAKAALETHEASLPAPAPVAFKATRSQSRRFN